MPRMTKRTTAAVAASFLMAGVIAVAVHTKSAPAPQPRAAVMRAAPAVAASGAPSAAVAGQPYEFVDLTAGPLIADGRAHEVDTHYRNNSAAPVTVAPQILVESGDRGPYLAPGDIRLERLDVSTHHWDAVPLDEQTGTLFTAIPRTGQALPAGAELDTQWRLTVAPGGTEAARHALVQPRIVVFTQQTSAAA